MAAKSIHEMISERSIDDARALLSGTLLPRRRTLRLAVHRPRGQSYAGWVTARSVHVSAIVKGEEWADWISPLASAFRPRIVGHIRECEVGTQVSVRIVSLSTISSILLIVYLAILGALTYGIVEAGFPGLLIVLVTSLLYAQIVLAPLVAWTQGSKYRSALYEWIRLAETTIED